MFEDEPEPYDAHVREAHKQFRDCGFTIAAMQFPRPAESLAALRRFNGLPAEIVEPFGWRFHPSAFARDHWLRTGRLG